jgi:hypothetical protein
MSWAYSFLPTMQHAAELASILSGLGVAKALDLPLGHIAQERQQGLEIDGFHQIVVEDSLVVASA